MSRFILLFHFTLICPDAVLEENIAGGGQCSLPNRGVESTESSAPSSERRTWENRGDEGARCGVEYGTSVPSPAD